MRKPLIKFETKVKLCFHRFYFETGFSLLNYAKYLIVAFGAYDIISNKNIERTIIAGILYGVFCYVLGYLWYKTDFAKAQNEVSNRINLLAIEIRNSLKDKKKPG